MNVDAIDLKILKYLQDNARLSNQELADLVNLSASACHRRVKILETNGIIENIKQKLIMKKLGIKIEAIVEIKLAQLTENDHNFLSQIKNFDEVINAYIITGESNYVLHVATKDLNSFLILLLIHSIKLKVW